MKCVRHQLTTLVLHSRYSACCGRSTLSNHSNAGVVHAVVWQFRMVFSQVCLNCYMVADRRVQELGFRVWVSCHLAPLAILCCLRPAGFSAVCCQTVVSCCLTAALEQSWIAPAVARPLGRLQENHQRRRARILLLTEAAAGWRQTA